MALAHLQQAEGLFAQGRVVLSQAIEQAFEETPGIALAAAQSEPEALPARVEAFAEFDGQGTLAESGGRGDQQQATVQSVAQSTAKTRARHMGRRQRGRKKRLAVGRTADGVPEKVREKSVITRFLGLCMGRERSGD